MAIHGSEIQPEATKIAKLMITARMRKPINTQNMARASALVSLGGGSRGGICFVRLPLALATFLPSSRLNFRFC